MGSWVVDGCSLRPQSSRWSRAAPPQSARQAATHPVLQQTAADCKKIGPSPGVVVLGLACADERNLVDPATWNVGASSAHWAENAFASAYEWDLPDTVPAAGAPLTLKVATAEITPDAGRQVVRAHRGERRLHASATAARASRSRRSRCARRTAGRPRRT